MKTIWKYNLPLAESAHLRIPAADEGILKVLLTDTLDSADRPQFALWARVDPEAPEQSVFVTIVGTGHIIPHDAGGYLDTVAQGIYYWHFFVRYGEA